MKTRVWCKKHQRWHTKHAAHHCKQGTCGQPDEWVGKDGLPRRCSEVKRA